MAAEDEMTPTMTEARRQCAVPLPEAAFAPLVAAASGCQPAVQVCLAAYLYNLRAAERMVTLPLLMASSSVHQRRFQQLHMAQRIRALKDVGPGGQLTQDHEDRARAEGMKLMDEDVRMRTDWFAKQTLHELGEHLKEPEYAAAIAETLRQSTVLAWGAIEVVLRDAMRLRTGVEPTSPRAALRALFPEHPTGDEALRHLRLWRLFQQRHVIVHRRGIVDQQYVDATNDAVSPGSELVITPAEFEGHVTTAIVFGVELGKRI